MSVGIELITKERNQQLVKYPVGADTIGHLVPFAKYCLFENNDAEKDEFGKYLIEEFGFTQLYLDKISNKPFAERLAIAGALLAAELDVIAYLNEEE